MRRFRSGFVATALAVVGMTASGVTGCGSKDTRTAAESHPVLVKKPSASLVDEIVDAAHDEARDGARPSDRASALRPKTHIECPEINECSGIDLYRGWYVVHNDSGDEPRLFASSSLDFRTPEVLEVEGANAVDWEEITVYDGDLLVCDFGDNARRRDSVELYRVRIVDEAAGGHAADLVATYRVAYPDGPHDAEAAFVIRGVLYVVTKDRGDGTRVYRFDELASTAELGDDGLNVPTHIGMLDLDAHDQVTAGTYDPVSDTVALLTYSAIVTYPGSRLSGKPARVHRFWGRQAESICVADRNLVVTNEQRDVFVIPGLLDGFEPGALVPPNETLRLPLVSQATPITGTPVPLKGADPAESLRLAIDDEWVLIDARLRVDTEFHPVRVDTPSVGSCLLVMFTEREHHHVDERDVQLALGVDAEGAVGVWRVGLGGEALSVVPVANARVDGNKRENTLAVSVRVPLREVFPTGVVPDAFRFDARGIRLRAGDQPHFSGDDLFAIYRPYVWGRVDVVR